MSEFDDTSDMTDDECRQMLRVVANERDALRAEVKRLRADAERYRWLRSEMDADIAVVRGFGAVDSGSTGVAATYEEALFFDKLDAAIDAARGES